MTLLVRRSDLVVVEIAGREFQTWEEYEIQQDLLVPGSAFSLTLRVQGTERQRRSVPELIGNSDLRVRIYIARDATAPALRSLQFVGVIKKMAVRDSRAESTVITLQGNDLGSELASASCDPTLVITDETTFLDAMRRVTTAFGIDIVADGVLSRQLASGGRAMRSREELRRAYARSTGRPVA
jgi:prophage tail gpP-like protein